MRGATGRDDVARVIVVYCCCIRFVRICWQKCNVTEVDVQHALLSGDPQDQIAIAYNLIIDNKRFYDEGCSSVKMFSF